MTAIEAALDELEDYGEGDDWADSIVQRLAFRHIAESPSCTGYCIASSGRTLCCACDWQLSGRMEDHGEVRSGRFVLAALATIGSAIAAAINASETFRTIVDADNEGEALMKALADLREQFPNATIADVKIRRIPDEDEVS